MYEKMYQLLSDLYLHDAQLDHKYISVEEFNNEYSNEKIIVTKYVIIVLDKYQYLYQYFSSKMKKFTITNKLLTYNNTFAPDIICSFIPKDNIYVEYYDRNTIVYLRYDFFKRTFIYITYYELDKKILEYMEAYYLLNNI